MDELELLSECRLCPRECGADRFISPSGWCRSGIQPGIASVGPHFGEEPIISGNKGICNVFFTHCNLQCVFCQNFQISDNKTDLQHCIMPLPEVVRNIAFFLDQGCHAVGFVSPSHWIPQVKIIISMLKEKGYSPVFLYNSNGYDKVESLRSLQGYIDIYLPDLKYSESEIAGEFSGAVDYPERAALAIKEMYRQKGSTLITDDKGQAVSGLIIRHLVLPGHSENSKKVLRFIATELSKNVHISLMSQYHPVHHAAEHEGLNSTLSADEYREVVHEMEKLGLNKGWVQALESSGHYLPDFDKEEPFKL
jgi:putative pyruvate formate lyase activating enzyme